MKLYKGSTRWNRIGWFRHAANRLKKGRKSLPARFYFRDHVTPIQRGFSFRRCATNESTTPRKHLYLAPRFLYQPSVYHRKFPSSRNCEVPRTYLRESSRSTDDCGRKKTTRLGFLEKSNGTSVEGQPLCKQHLEPEQWPRINFSHSFAPLPQYRANYS